MSANMNIDPFYEENVAPRLPGRLLDFHAHLWMADQWLRKAGAEDINNSADLGFSPAANYVSTELEYPVRTLMEDGGRCFPGKDYHAVCFGQPTPAVDTGMTNAYVAGSAKGNPRLFPLMVAGSGKIQPRAIEDELDANGFFGFKVYLDWIGNDYGSIRVEDMLTDAEMEIADRRCLVLLLHVPRAGRLADPEIQAGVKRLSRNCPNASIVLAHCGRCYHPIEINRAIASVADLGNVYMDTSFVMEPIVLLAALKVMGAGRLLFATDLPIAAMLGKRVNIRDHWVDVVAKGYPECQYRVPSGAFTPMYIAQEIALAVIIAADAAGLGDEDSLGNIFYRNGMGLLGRVAGGKPFAQKAVYS